MKKGRPAIAKAKRQRRRNITLSDALAAKAERIGEGNMSLGIRRALNRYQQ